MPHSPRSRPKGRSNNSSRGNEKIQFHTSSAFAARDITPPLGQLFARALAPRQRRPPRPRSSSSNRTRVPPSSFPFFPPFTSLYWRGTSVPLFKIRRLESLFSYQNFTFFNLLHTPRLCFSLLEVGKGIGPDGKRFEVRLWSLNRCFGNRLSSCPRSHGV